MARRVKSAIMDSREARKNLSVRDKPHYVTVDRGLHLGYRKGKRGGKWVARCYVDGDYSVQTFAVADDNRDQDGVTVLDFWQAQAREPPRRISPGYFAMVFIPRSVAVDCSYRE